MTKVKSEPVDDDGDRRDKEQTPWIEWKNSKDDPIILDDDDEDVVTTPAVRHDVAPETETQNGHEFDTEMLNHEGLDAEAQNNEGLDTEMQNNEGLDTDTQNNEGLNIGMQDIETPEDQNGFPANPQEPSNTSEPMVENSAAADAEPLHASADEPQDDIMEENHDIPSNTELSSNTATSSAQPHGLNLGSSVLRPKPTSNGALGMTEGERRRKVGQAQAILTARLEAVRAGGGQRAVSSAANGYGVAGPSHSRGEDQADDADAEEAEHKRLCQEWRKIERAYLRREKNSKTELEEEIEFMRLRRAEEARVRYYNEARERELEESHEVIDGEPLFVPTHTVKKPYWRLRDDEEEYHVDSDEGEDAHDDKRQRLNVQKPARIPKHVDDEALEAMMESEPEQPQQPKKGRKKGKVAAKDNTVPSKSKGKSKAKAKATTTGGEKAKKKRGRKNEPKNPLGNVNSLLNSNIFDDAAGNSNRKAQPGFTGGKGGRTKAIGELLSGLTEEERKTALVDKKYLESACTDFATQRAVVPVGLDENPHLEEPGWRLKGMTCVLKHYQLLGSAFMRRREKCGAEPLGGLCADQMGLGSESSCFIASCGL